MTKKSNFTKAQKEELANIFQEQFKEFMPAFMCNPGATLIAQDLDGLDKKWRDGAKEYIDLDGKQMIVASEDYVDPVTGKKHFTWEEAMALEKDGKLPKGWHIPTVFDWTVIATKYGYRQQEDGSIEESGDFLKKSLGLDYNGCEYRDDSGDYNENPDSGTVNDVGTNGYYWSASATSTASIAYSLGFNSSGVYPQCSGYEYCGLSVRCVAER